MDRRVDNLMTGKGGETAVLSELLFRGFNANILLVDAGVDIAAIKKKKTFLIQVKTKHWNKDNKFLVVLELDTLRRYKKANVFIILVGRDRKTKMNDFIILPARVLFKSSLKRGPSKSQRGKQAYKFWFRKRTRDEGVQLVGYGDVSKYINAWHLIK